MANSITNIESRDPHISYLQEVKKSHSCFIQPLPDSADCYERVSILEKKDMIKKGSLLKKSPEAFSFLKTLTWKEKITLLQHACSYYSYQGRYDVFSFKSLSKLVGEIWNECLETEDYLEKGDYQDLKQAFHKYIKHLGAENKNTIEEAQEIKKELELLPVNSFYFVRQKCTVIEFQRTSTTTFTISLYAETFPRNEVHIYKHVHQNFIFSDELKTDFLRAILEGPPHLDAFAWFQYYFMMYDCHVKKLPPSNFFEKTQRTCLKKIFIQHKGEKAYRKFILKVKLYLLLQIYHQLAKNIQENSIDGKYLRSVFRDASQNILKSLEHKLRKGFLDEQHPLVLSIRATALDILDNLEQVEKEIAKSKKEAALYKITCYPEETANNMRKAILSEAEFKIEQEITSSFVAKEISPALVQIKSDEDLEKLHGLLMRWNEYKKDYKDLVITEIEYFIMHLPLPYKASFLNQSCLWDLTPSTTKNLLLQLHDLIILYDELIDFDVIPEEKNHFFALYAIIHHLAIRYEQNFLSGSHSLANFAIFFNGPDMVRSKMEHFNLPEDYSRRDEIFKYFCDFNKDKKDKSIFCNGNLMKIEEKSLLKKSEISSSSISQYFLSLAACGKPKDSLMSLEENFKTCKPIAFLADHFKHVGILFRAAGIIRSLAGDFRARGSWNETTNSWIAKTNVSVKISADRNKDNPTVLEIFCYLPDAVCQHSNSTVEDYRLKKSLPWQEQFIFHYENSRYVKENINQDHKL